MQPAFLSILVFPPPTTCAQILSGFDRTRAGLASDRGEAFGVKRIDRHIVCRDVGLQPFQGPVGDWVYFYEFVLSVPFGEWCSFTIARLAAPQSRDPTLPTGQRALERTHLAHLAAGLSIFNRHTEAIDSIARNERFHLDRVGGDDANLETIAALTFIERLKCLGKVPARIECEHINVRTACGDGVKNGLVFQTKARRERHTAENCAGDLSQAILKLIDLGNPPIERRHVVYGPGSWTLRGARGPWRSSLGARRLGGAALA